jgi:hypothetical protein
VCEEFVDCNGAKAGRADDCWLRGVDIVESGVWGSRRRRCRSDDERRRRQTVVVRGKGLGFTVASR